MKVVRLKAPASVANLRLLEEDPPRPQAGEVLVRLRAGSLNPHDDFVARGIIPAADGRIPLSDGAGEVLACGEGVTDFRVGDAVVSTFWPYWLSGEMTAAIRREIPGETMDGYAREYACTPAHFFTRAPAGYSHAQAATLPCAGVTAWRGLVTQGKVKPGDTVLVMGSGAVSLFALQFAKAAGARVLATSSSEEKLEKLKRLGCRRCHQLQGDAELGRADAKALTEGRGVDHVIEVGGPATFAQYDGRMQAWRTHRGDRIAIGRHGRGEHPGLVFLPTARERNLDRQPGRSGRHDPRDRSKPARARDRSKLRSRRDCCRIGALPNAKPFRKDRH